jgi:hypothetical protein
LAIDLPLNSVDLKYLSQNNATSLATPSISSPNTSTNLSSLESPKSFEHSSQTPYLSLISLLRTDLIDINATKHID